MNLKPPAKTPYTFKEAYKGIQAANPGSSLEDAMKAAVKLYPHLHERFLKSGGLEDEERAERNRNTDAVLSVAAEAKKAGMPLKDYMQKKGILR